MKKCHRIAILEDHPLTRAGMKLALQPHHSIAIEAGTAGELFCRLESQQEGVDLLLLDLSLPDMTGVQVAQRIKKEHQGIKILVCSIDTSPDTVRQLLEIGVEGLLSKNSSDVTICKAATAIINGGHFYLEDEEKLERSILISKNQKSIVPLSDREREVMIGFCKGMTSFEIADAMFLSQRTVENHKQHIFRKCGINNTVELILYGINNGIITI